MIKAEEAGRPASPVAFGALESEHASLRSLAEGLERRLASLARAGRSVDGAAETESRAALSVFRRQLVDHFAHEEEGGLLDLAAATAPRLADRIEGLRAQHDELRARVDALVDEAAADAWERLAERFAALRGDLLEHERVENEMMQSAYLEDLGGRG